MSDTTEEHTGNPNWPPNPQPPSPEELEPPLLQDPPIRWLPESPGGDQVECDGRGHKFPPEAIELAAQAIAAASPTAGGG